MIQRHAFPLQELQPDAPREVQLLSFIGQIFLQPFSLEDNLLALLTALTAGSGVGFNRAMLFLVEGRTLRGRWWLGPPTPEEACTIWEVLSTPGIGFVEIVDYNRALLERREGGLSHRVERLSYNLDEGRDTIPSLSARRREILHVRDADCEPLVDEGFRDVIGVREFLCIPLVSRDDVVGEIVVDNAFTGAPIEAPDIRLACLCGLIAGNYIYTSLLTKKMMDMEKLAALGEAGVFLLHQLRNPLTVIGGFADQLLDVKLSESKKKRNLTIIRKEIKRLERVIGKIGRLTRLNSGPVVSLDPKSMIEELLALPAIKVKGRGRHIRFECPPDLPDALGHRLDAAEAVRNVLDNALEAATWGGEVVIRCAGGPDRTVVISIADNGPGIAPGMRERLFEPFATSKKNGMGLGLAFVKRVMDIAGGRVEVESREGRGTEVRLMFRAGGKE